MRIALILATAASLYAQPGAPGVVDGQTLWTVRAPLGGFSPEARAADVQSNIIHIAGDAFRDSAEIRIVPGPADTMILIDRVYVTSVTDEDARVEGASRDALTASRSRAVTAAIERYRAARSAQSLARATALSAGAFVLMIFAFIAIHLVYKRLSTWLENAIDRAVAARKLGRVLRIFENTLEVFLRTGLQLTAATGALVVATIAAAYILGRFASTQSLSDVIAGSVSGAVKNGAFTLASYLPNLFVLAVVAVLTTGFIRAAKTLKLAFQSGRIVSKSFHAEWAAPTYRLAQLLLTVLGIVVAFPYLPGGDSPALRGASIFVGVLVSLGSGSAMGNVISGFILIYMRAFKAGDRVQIGDAIGDVVEQSLLVTRVRTIKNAEVIVPNSAVLGGQVINYSAYASGDGLIVHTSVTIGYNVPWPTVHELLIAAALKTPFVLQDPKPFVLQRALNDFHVGYEINVYTRAASRMVEIQAGLHKNIQECFKEGGVEIMSPTYLAMRDGNASTIPS
ncbi:MAG: mechanosensitive ion channel [Acidobacteria bacterium]|nr:mechanosensitive ion channel [Acidobacteriota bacterium]